MNVGRAAALAAEVDALAADVEVRRRVARPTTSMPQTGSIAVAGAAAPARARCARRPSGRGSRSRCRPGVRAPMSSPAGVWTCARSASSTSSDVAAPRRRACGLATSADVADAGLAARAPARASSSSPCEATISAASDALRLDAVARDVVARGRARPSSSARAIGVSPTIDDRAARPAAARGRSPASRRSGTGCARRRRRRARLVLAAASARAAGAAAPPRRSPARARRAAAPTPARRRRRRSPSIVPSASTSAESPGRTLVGLAARTTVAVTNGTRSASSCSIALRRDRP